MLMDRLYVDCLYVLIIKSKFLNVKIHGIVLLSEQDLAPINH